MTEKRFIQPYLFVIIITYHLCACTVNPKDQFDFDPVYSTHPVKVGISVTGSFQNVEISYPLLNDIELGKVSVKLFLQVFRSMFEETDVLPKWPPWKIRENISGFDGIIELDTLNFSFSVGDDFVNPSKISISYKVCLYETDGKVVNCWTTQSEKYHQRKPYEFDLASSSIQPVIEDAMREAIAEFMILFQNNKSVKSWVNKN